MLIIFDLDDTLIQTSRLITPWRFEKVLQALGLQQDLYAKLSCDLMNCHMSFDSSQEALQAVFKTHDIHRTHFDVAKGFLDSFDDTIPVELFSGVEILLKVLKTNHKIVLVTKGRQDQQKLKIQKAGLSDGFFEHMIIVDTGSKKQAFSQLATGYDSKNVLVVGDRISADLSPAKDLGFKTCLVRQGRGEFQKISSTIVDYVIQDVTELENLLKSIQ